MVPLRKHWPGNPKAEGGLLVWPCTRMPAGELRALMVTLEMSLRSWLCLISELSTTPIQRPGRYQGPQCPLAWPLHVTELGPRWWDSDNRTMATRGSFQPYKPQTRRGDTRVQTFWETSLGANSGHHLSRLKTAIAWLRAIICIKHENLQSLWKVWHDAQGAFINLKAASHTFKKVTLWNG